MGGFDKLIKDIRAAAMGAIIVKPVVKGGIRHILNVGPTIPIDLGRKKGPNAIAKRQK